MRNEFISELHLLLPVLLEDLLLREAPRFKMRADAESADHLADARARKYLATQMEQYFFGAGADRPAGYVPPAGD